MIYYIICIVITAQIFIRRLNYKCQLLLFKIWFIILGTLSALRWERGTDWQPYYNNFMNNITITEFITDIHFDKGYQLLNYISKIIYDDYTIFLFLQAIILYSIYYYSIKKYSGSILVSLWLYYMYYLGNLFFVRSTIALSIIVLSVNYIVKKEKLKFLILVLVASLLHYSAFIFLPAYFIFNNFKLRKEKYLYIFILGILVICFSNEIIKYIFEKYYPHRLVYFDQNFISTVGPKSKYLFKAIITRGFFCLLYLSLLKDMEKQNKYARNFFNLYFIGAILNIATSNINPMLSRVSEFYEFSQIFLISYINFNTKNIFKKIIIIIALIYFIYNFIIALNSYEELYIPYKTIFNKELEVKLY